MSPKRLGFPLITIAAVIVISAAAQPLGQGTKEWGPVGPIRTLPCTVGPILPVMPQALDDPGAAIIEGTWIVDIIGAAGQTVTQGLFTFNRGGGLTGDGIGPNPTLRGTWHGTWARAGFRQFLVTQVRAAFDSAGNPTARRKLRDLITVNATGDEYSGEFIEETFDLSGNLISTARLRECAKRLVVEPVQ